jgi:hypothetical protein
VGSGTRIGLRTLAFEKGRYQFDGTHPRPRRESAPPEHSEALIGVARTGRQPARVSTKNTTNTSDGFGSLVIAFNNLRWLSIIFR